MIETTNLTKTLGKHSPIRDVSFCAQHRECLGLFGNQGSGKTTLIKLLSGVTAPSSGNLKIYGHDMATHPLQAKKLIGYQPALALSHSTMSVKSFLDFMAQVRGLRGREKRKMVDQAVARLELGRQLKCPVETLSTGLQRKVAIAQAILHNPSLLLLDEPLEGLPPHQKHRTRMLVKSLCDEMTVIVASRAPGELAGLCNRALVIADGRLVADASPLQLQRNSRHYQAVTLATDTPLDLLALAVLPGVAGIEDHQEDAGTVTVLAMPGQSIYPHINALIASRGWNINALSLEPGRLDEAIHHLIQEPSI